MKKFKKKVLGTVEKIVKISNENFNAVEGPGGCSLFFHQPKRPEATKSKEAK